MMDENIDDVAFSSPTGDGVGFSHLVIYGDYGNTEPRYKRFLRWVSRGRLHSLIIYSGPPLHG